MSLIFSKIKTLCLLYLTPRPFYNKPKNHSEAATTAPIPLLLASTLPAALFFLDVAELVLDGWDE